MIRLAKDDEVEFIDDEKVHAVGGRLSLRGTRGKVLGEHGLYDGYVMWIPHNDLMRPGGTDDMYWISPERQLLVVSKVDTGKFPHKCPRCGFPAYVGLNSVDCSASCR